ncbi:MAG: TIR domain-containing protein, partial [Clostridia bacterium]|nr:TIR domain-containing protein [Clostridia bacterium]
MHEVFISYSSKDKTIADAVCNYLETNGVKCWYAPRDIAPGETWEGAIVKAIQEASIFVLVFTENSNTSEQVQREVSNAFRSMCIVIPFKVDQTEASPNLSYYLANTHWLDAMTPPLEVHLAKLYEDVQRIKDGEKTDLHKEENPKNDQSKEKLPVTDSPREYPQKDQSGEEPPVPDPVPWWKRKLVVFAGFLILTGIIFALLFLNRPYCIEGDRNSDKVRSIQEAISTYGYYDGELNGNFDYKTVQAIVKLFDSAGRKIGKQGNRVSLSSEDRLWILSYKPDHTQSPSLTAKPEISPTTPAVTGKPVLTPTPTETPAAATTSENNSDTILNGHGTKTYSNGAVYDGDFVNGQRSGKGKLTYANGAVYEGDWTDNNKNGQGKMIYAGGAVYEGEWKNDKINGRGKMTYSNGYVYEGEWKDGERNGIGKLTYANGNTYEGKWENDNPSGSGVFTWADSTEEHPHVLVANWKNNKINGLGKMTYSNGDVYEGEWKDDKRNGQGKMSYSNGDVYEGEWKDNKRNGIGKLTYANGDTYEGKWENDNPSGSGVFTWADSTEEHPHVLVANWKNNKI